MSTRQEKHRLGVICVLAIWSLGMTAFADAAPEYLADISGERMVYSTQAWGKLGLNTAVVPLDGRAAMPLQIKDKKFERGLGTHARGEIVLELDGRYKTFDAEVGVQWQAGNVGSVVFQVFVDDEKRFDSGVMKENDAARAVSVSVQGAAELRLVVSDAGDGITCDCADWAEARLTPDPAASPATASATADVAPFARVVTWDPTRTEGTKAKRTEEFPAEDVFLSTEVLPNPDGAYTTPRAANGSSCIGLEWAERRFVRHVALEFPDPAKAPSPDGVRVQCWTGESPWQGAWNTVEGPIEAKDGRWTLSLRAAKNADVRLGTEKVRWIFPATSTPIVIKGLSAYTNSRIAAVRLSISGGNRTGNPAAKIEMYNGAIARPEGASLTCTWGPAEPTLVADIRYFKARPWKTDRTVLRFQLPGAAFGVAVDDVLANDFVFVPSADLLVNAKQADTAAAAKGAGKKTILERVREMPDQTFAQAWEKVHNPVQDNGPMLLSLACDNRKFVAQRDGTLTFCLYDAPDQENGFPDTYPCKIVPQFGSGKAAEVTRRLDGGWLPAPVTTVNDGGVVYTQRTYVAPVGGESLPDKAPWLCQQALCVAEFVVENTQATDMPVSIKTTMCSDVKNNQFPQLTQNSDGVLAAAGDRMLAFLDTAGAAPLTVKTAAGQVELSGALPPKGVARCVLYIPAWRMAPTDYPSLKGADKWYRGFDAYWRRVLEPATAIEVPDEFLTNVIRASQVHCLLAARNENQCERVSAWISSDRYGPLESEAHSVIRGMDLMGHDEFAQRALDYFVHRYSPEGYLTTGYTLMGTGWHLWTLAEHFERTQDQEWMKRIAPSVANACRWIMRQREKTKRLNAHGEKAPEYGLAPPGVGADWNRYAYRFAIQAHYCAGLAQAGQALAEVGHPEAGRFIEDAKAFREDILRAYRWTQARSPVVKLANDAWVPAYPAMLNCFGRIEDIIPGEDGNRSWAYDVELGAHHMAALGILPIDSPDVDGMMNHMEDFWFLHSGMGDYPGDKSQADWFNLGGFAKIQPYYARNAEICALRDDVKPFIRSYFNTIPTLLSREDLSFWEHFHNTGGWNKTHETGYFLAQTRLMMVIERGDELWLAPFVTNNWLKDGMTISVRNARTRFGPVSYTITSRVATGSIEATIEPPTRTPPKQIVLRLRHPDGMPIRSVTINGKSHTDFDTAQIRLSQSPNPIAIWAKY